MNIPTAGRTVQLLKRIFDTGTSTTPFTASPCKKPSLPLRSADQPFERVTPESQGISSDHIRRFLTELEQGGDLHMQTVLILRSGKLLCAASYGAQTTDAPKCTFSACKSITALAIGLLIDDGLLRPDDTVSSIFPDRMTPAAARRFRSLTVEDLLTMRSGISFAEPQSAAEDNWLSCIFSDTLSPEPGSAFQYNSINTYLLSAIVCRISGESMSAFLQRRLFEPMGITDTFWERSGEGIEKGGWGFYIRPEDMAKLGQLVMDGGIWNGRRLISREYLSAAAAAHASPPAGLGDFDYGYQIWVGRRDSTFLFNGMLGQNVLGFRRNGVLVVTNAGADTDYQRSRFFGIVSRYFTGSFPEKLPEQPTAFRRLQSHIEALSYFNRRTEELPLSAAPFFDRTFAASDPSAPSTGLLPLLLQILHNNFASGLVSMTLRIREKLPELIYCEQDAAYRIPIGLGKPYLSELSFRGDHFRIAAHGRFTHDEEERPVFYVRLEFLETPSVRILKLVLNGNDLLLKQSETPGGPYLFEKLCAAAQQPLLRPLLHLAIGGSEEDFLAYKAQKIMSPVLRMTEP